LSTSAVEEWRTTATQTTARSVASLLNNRPGLAHTVKISKLARAPARQPIDASTARAVRRLLGLPLTHSCGMAFAKIMVANCANGRSPLNRRARHRNLTAAPMVEPAPAKHQARAAEITACLCTRTSCAAREAGKPDPAIPAAACLKISPPKPQQRRSRSSSGCNTLAC
jgi:hypothetical protein